MEISLVLVSVGGIVFLAHLLSALFTKTRIPDVLPLVVLGLLLGPVFNVLTPESLGKVGGVFAVITLVIMLFEGGLGLELTTLRQSLARGTFLTIVSFVFTVLIVAGIGVAVIRLPLLQSVMLGAILGGTSSAVVMPIVERLSLQDRNRSILVLESTFSDVLCIVLTLALLKVGEAADLHMGPMVGQVAASFLLAALVGAGAALFWSLILHKVHRLENGTFTTPAFVFIVYGLTELLGWSGAIAALGFGVVLGNIRSLPLHQKLRPIGLDDIEKSFFSEIVFLLKTFFFVYIGLSIRLNSALLAAAGLLITLAIFLVRIPAVRVCLEKSTPRLDATLAAVLVPKGLAAAVLASLPLQAGMAGGSLMQTVIYSVILFSICVTAVLAFLAEKNWLKQPYSVVFGGYETSAAATKDTTPTPPPPSFPA